MKEKLDFTAPHVLRSTGEYEAAIAEVDALLDLDPVPSSVEYDRLEFLSVLIEAYEEAHYPLRETLTPQEMVDFMLDQRGLSRSDLGAILGGRSRVSEFFNGRRRLSISQIQRLRQYLGIPADLLIERNISALSDQSTILA